MSRASRTVVSRPPENWAPISRTPARQRLRRLMRSPLRFFTSHAGHWLDASILKLMDEGEPCCNKPFTPLLHSDTVQRSH